MIAINFIVLFLALYLIFSHVDVEQRALMVIGY